MSIYGNLPPVQSDVARTRQQQSERLQQQRTAATATNEGSGSHSSAAADSLDDGAMRQVKALAQQVQQSDNKDLHRLEDLRERIASGDYTAEPEELADILLPVLRGDHPLS